MNSTAIRLRVEDFVEVTHAYIMKGLQLFSSSVEFYSYFEEMMRHYSQYQSNVGLRRKRASVRLTTDEITEIKKLQNEYIGSRFSDIVLALNRIGSYYFWKYGMEV